MRSDTYFPWPWQHVDELVEHMIASIRKTVVVKYTALLVLHLASAMSGENSSLFFFLESKDRRGEGHFYLSLFFVSVCKQCSYRVEAQPNHKYRLRICPLLY